MSELRDWLESRRPAPPESLRHEIHVGAGLVPAHGDAEEVHQSDDQGAHKGRPYSNGDHGGDAVAMVLADAALDHLRAAMNASPDRAAADDLLTADALLTYACERAAEAGPDALREFTRAYDPARFAELLPSEET